jgi:hypothetical protein
LPSYTPKSQPGIPVLLDDHEKLEPDGSHQLVLPGSHVVVLGSNVVVDGLTVVEGTVVVGSVVEVVVSLVVSGSPVDSPSVPLPAVKSLRPHPDSVSAITAARTSQELMVWQVWQVPAGRGRLV